MFRSALVVVVCVVLFDIHIASAILPGKGMGACSPDRPDCVTSSVRGAANPTSTSSLPRKVQFLPKIINPMAARLLMSDNHTLEEHPDVSDNGMVFDDKFELSVHPNSGWLGEYDGEEMLGFRARRIDPETGIPVIPRSLRPYVDAEGTIFGTSLNTTYMSLNGLRDVMRSLVVAPNGAVHSDWDPLDDTRRYDVAGNFCDCSVSASCDCRALHSDLFLDLSAPTTDYTASYYRAKRRPFAGEEGFEGGVERIRLENDAVDVFDRPLLVNANGRVAGQPRFRLPDDEVEEVFYLEARKRRGFEVIPGRIMEVWGWRGGKVEDFEFDADGFLSGGFIVVGPHPHTDVNDRVMFGEKRHGPFGYGFTKHDADALGGVWLEDDSPFSDLEVRTPGPEMRFTDGRRTRIYVVNRMEDDHEEKVTVHWHGMDLPHDMDGVPFENQTPIHVGTNWTYEYQIPNIGSRWYHQHFNTHITLGMGMFGPVSAEYPDEIKTWDREYVTQVADVQSRYTLNGNSFPGTIERLSGHFKDQMTILRSFPAEDDTGDTIVEIVNEPRAPLTVDVLHVPQTNPDPAHGGPIRAGTGGVSQSDGAHTNQGHNIPNRIQGRRVLIAGHVEEGLVYPKATLNGYHYVTKEGSDEPAVLLRVPRVGLEGSPGGVGGTLYVWRKHKSSADRPMLQNNGNSGAHFKLNYGEEVMMRWFNAATQAHPLHIHGHQWNIFAEDGNLLDSPFVRNVYLLAQAGTFDAKVNCNNPNRFGGWMLHCHNLNHLANADNPWPGGEEYPGGMLSHLDYTGEDRMRGVVSHEFHTQPFNELPPSCEASPRSLEVGRDVLGQAALPGASFIHLNVTTGYGFDELTQDAFGEITRLRWELISSPVPVDSPVTPRLSDRSLADPRVMDLVEDGEYKFEVIVRGANFERANPNDETSCVDEVVVNVAGPDTEGRVVVDDLGDSRITAHGSPLNLRLEAGSDRGFITHPLFKARVEPPLVLSVTGAPVVVDDAGESVDVNGVFDRVEVLGDVPVYVRDDIKVARVMRDPKIKTHGVPAAVDLVAGADIGTITLHLFQGGLVSADGSTVDMQFVITDVSDEELARLVGAAHAPLLADVTDAACETDADFSIPPARPREMEVVFRHDPGHVGAAGEGEVPSQGPRGNSEYSPLKRFTFQGRIVTVNAPLIVWGGGDSQRLVTDEGGCDGRIRSIPPSERWLGGGPPRCAEEDGPLDRFQGGQVVNVDTGAMEVTVKLHRAVVHNDGVFPYYSVFEASSPSAAGYLGVLHAPKLALLGGAAPVLPSLMQFGNGFPAVGGGGGPDGFQPGIASITAESEAYLPMWQVSWLLYNCGKIPAEFDWPLDRIIARGQNKWFEGRNVGQGDLPVGGSGIEGFDPSVDPFDPYQMKGGLKGHSCPEFVADITKNEAGVLYLDTWSDLVDDHDLFVTADPVGNEQGAGPELVVNGPQLLTVDMFNSNPPDNGVSLPQVPVYDWVLVKRVSPGDGDDEVLFTAPGGSLVASPPVGGWIPVGAAAAVVDMEMALGRDESIAPKDVYVAVADASDEVFADKFGAVFAPRLSLAPVEAVEYAIFSDDLDAPQFATNRSVDLVLSYDAGLVAAGENPPMGNPRYSPLKRFLYDGKMITVNAPMVVWGEEPGQRLLIDQGGCDPLIRSILPSSNWEGGGPPDCTDREHFLDRHQGGQVLRIDLEAMEVTVKLHRAVLRDDGTVPYYSVFEASSPSAAGAMGVVHAPKLSNLLRSESGNSTADSNGGELVTAVDSLRQVGNGVKWPSGGPNRFQPAVVPFVGGDVQMYTPMWHVTWLLFNCGPGVNGTGEVGGVIPVGEEIWLPGANVVQGDEPGPGGVVGFDPAVSESFDPYQLRGGLKGASCPAYARSVTGHGDGMLYAGEWEGLKEQGLVFETDAPLGAELGNGVVPPLVMNCPMPVMVHPPSGVVQKEEVVSCGGSSDNSETPQPPDSNTNSSTGGGDVVPPGEEFEPRQFEISGGTGSLAWFMSEDGARPELFEPSSLTSLRDGDLATLQVRAGDVITVTVSGSGTRHGFLLVPEGEDAGLGTPEVFVRGVLDVDDDAGDFDLEVSQDRGLVDALGGSLWGVGGQRVGPAVLFVATVRAGNAGQSLLFACSVHAPATMLGRLEVIG